MNFQSWCFFKSWYLVEWIVFVEEEIEHVSEGLYAILLGLFWISWIYIKDAYTQELGIYYALFVASYSHLLSFSEKG